MSSIKIWSAATILLTCYAVLGICRFSVGAAAAQKNNETDREALIAFKRKISHDRHRVFDSWNDSIHFCQWPGITCSLRHQRVIYLELPSLKLVGSLPPHIGNLSFLRVFDVRSNGFNGDIPREISNLFRLRYLALTNNLFTGEIPGNLSGCTNLGALAIGNNMIVGSVPPSLASLSQLQVISMFKNHLSGNLPDALGNLSSLESISTAYNSLSGRLPASFGRLQNLKYVYLGGNEFTGAVPPEFFNISSLVDMVLPKNRLEGVLPQDLGLKLPNLQRFNVGNNSFSGAIPAWISNASNLIRLTMPMNNFTGTVPTLKNLNQLQWISISENQLGSEGIDDDLRFVKSINSTDLELLAIQRNNFHGKLPEAIGNLSSKLNILSVESNRLSGSVPASIENLRNLEFLSIGINRFIGGIPHTIGSLRQLKQLVVRENQLTGKIPSSFGNLTMLMYLDLAANYLDGTIPSSLGKCQSLLAIDLSENRLSGNIPPEVLSITSLSAGIDISRNQLSGPLPREIGNLKQLTLLYAFENKLSGEIPSSLGECVSLTKLVINNNSFQGNISSFLSPLTSTDYIDLSSNNFSGRVPAYLGKFQFLEYLNLSFNRLEGEVPTDGVFQNASGVSLQGNDKICGGIPELNLPPCHSDQPKRSSRYPHKVVIVPVCTVAVVLAIAISVLAFYLLRKRGKAPSAEALSLSGLWQVSYETLLKATDGFNTNNLIGVGGFGAVYQGVLEQEERMVAVKVLDLNRLGASRSFMAECEALRNIRHRNLVKIVTACSSVDFQGNDFKALVYEFMKNGSLDDWLHPLPSDNEVLKTLNFLQRLSIAIDVASALEYLHHHCGAIVVHCDLKPSNILLDDDMNGHVGDFGLARIFTDTHILDAANMSSSIGVRGTIGYAAPGN